MDTPDRTDRARARRTVFRRLVLGAFLCTAVLIAVLVVGVVLSATGLTFDPHGYGVFAGVLFAALLTPVALVLWMSYRSLRRRGE